MRRGAEREEGPGSLFCRASSPQGAPLNEGGDPGCARAAGRSGLTANRSPLAAAIVDGLLCFMLFPTLF